MRILPNHPRLRWLARLLIAWLALPYVLVLVYLIVPPISTLMLVDMLTGKRVERHWVPVSQLSPALVKAVLTSEDSAFCSHHGVDLRQMEKSIKKAQKKDTPVKATSTITQQTAKNLFFWGGRSWVRKALEIPLAFWMELIWSKERILEVYLNIAEWGKGVYGIDAAARNSFGVTAHSLSPQQAALLVVALPNPLERSAARPTSGHQQLAASVLSRSQNSSPDISCVQ